jgi:hypothetical protein
VGHCSADIEQVSQLLEAGAPARAAVGGPGVWDAVAATALARCRRKAVGLLLGGLVLLSVLCWTTALWFGALLLVPCVGAMTWGSVALRFWLRGRRLFGRAHWRPVGYRVATDIWAGLMFSTCVEVVELTGEGAPARRMRVRTLDGDDFRMGNPNLDELWVAADPSGRWAIGATLRDGRRRLLMLTRV